MWREKQRAFDINGAEHGSRIDIDEQVETLWNVDEFAFLRLQIVAPCLGFGPSLNVPEYFALRRDVAHTIDRDEKGWRVRHVRLVGRGALDRRRSGRNGGALAVVDPDFSGGALRESYSSDCNTFIAEDRNEASVHSFHHRRLSAAEGHCVERNSAVGACEEELGCACVRVGVIADRLDTVKLYLADATRP